MSKPKSSTKTVRVPKEYRVTVTATIHYITNVHSEDAPTRAAACALAKGALRNALLTGPAEVLPEEILYITAK
jgi:hypothetical protein